MRTAKIMVITENELRKELIDFSRPMIQDCLEDVINEGADGNPYLADVMDKGGFNKMAVADLIEMSEPWAECTIDMESDDGIEGIMGG